MADLEHAPTPAIAKPERADDAASSHVGAVNAALQSTGGQQVGPATVHDDTTSHAAADALGAKAFAAGSSVFFGAGQYAPGTAHGDDLLRHELTHVGQTRGLAAPEPGNFRVSDPGDREEHAARTGESGVSGQASTIYRDVTGGAAPAAAGAGAAAHGAEAAGRAVGVNDPAYKAWKAAISHHSRADAKAKWAALPGDKRALVAHESSDFVRSVIYTMGKDSPEVLKAHGKVDEFAYDIFVAPDFVHFLPTMRAAGLLTPFLQAQPLKGAMPVSISHALKKWVDTAQDVGEAKAMFQKVYPTLADTATPALGDATYSAVAWSLEQVRRLYSILNHYLPIGQVQTLTGGFVLITPPNFGWFEPDNMRVALPAHGGSISAAQDIHGHDMTGGDNSGTTGKYTKKNGKPGKQTTLGHYEGTALHEVGHGVGERMGGNAYAKNPGSYPGWTPLTADAWAASLWVAPTGHGDPHVPHAAQIDSATARAMFIAEIQNGAGTWVYTPPAGTAAPAAADITKWVRSRYANVPLFQWWDYLAVQGKSKDDSYSWNDPHARTRGAWTYSYLTRADQPFMKMKSDAYHHRPSWYGVSSPLEWFAEQYAHYYRTEKTGGGLIDPATKALLHKLDKESFAPTSADGKQGVVYPNAHGGPEAGAAGADASSTTAAAPETGRRPTLEPLFFPW